MTDHFFNSTRIFFDLNKDTYASDLANCGWPDFTDAKYQKQKKEMQKTIKKMIDELSTKYTDPDPDCPKSDLRPHADDWVFKVPEDILPGDGKAVGYVYGYRVWRFNLAKGVLTSTHVSYNEWEPKKAQHAKDIYPGMYRGRGAGIYAFKEYKKLSTTYFADVFGKIALWGQIKEHKEGYRAEYAYPVEFLKIIGVAPQTESILLRALSEIYLPGGHHGHR